MTCALDVFRLPIYNLVHVMIRIRFDFIAVLLLVLSTCKCKCKLNHQQQQIMKRFLAKEAICNKLRINVFTKHSMKYERSIGYMYHFTRKYSS